MDFVVGYMVCYNCTGEGISLRLKMPIYETRKDTCVASDIIKPYGRRVRVCPESERREAAFKFLEVYKKEKKLK